MTRRTSRFVPARSAWKIAECSLSTGSRVPPRRLASSMTRGPATTSVSLLARATILPASRAAQVPCRPAAPTIALRTRSVSGSLAIRANPSGPESTSMPDPCNWPSTAAAAEGSARAM